MSIRKFYMTNGKSQPQYQLVIVRIIHPMSNTKISVILIKRLLKALSLLINLSMLDEYAIYIFIIDLIMCAVGKMTPWRARYIRSHPIRNDWDTNYHLHINILNIFIQQRDILVVLMLYRAYSGDRSENITKMYITLMRTLCKATIVA